MTPELEEQVTRLETLVYKFEDRFTAFSDEQLSAVPAPGKWSKKQILGHLIDSAANNHHKFVRAQFEDTPAIGYDQNQWNSFGYYQQMPGERLIRFWQEYNLHLAALIRLIPDHLMMRPCKTGEMVAPLHWFFTDYLAHLEHHLKQMES